MSDKIDHKTSSELGVAAASFILRGFMAQPIEKCEACFGVGVSTYLLTYAAVTIGMSKDQLLSMLEEVCNNVIDSVELNEKKEAGNEDPPQVPHKRSLN